MNNKILGNKFEQDICNFLSDQGYFVIYIEGGKHTNAQPCDIVAIKDDEPYLLDCKTLENKTGRFPIDRIEENQRLAYERYKECGNFDYYLAILWNNNLYLKNLDDIDFKEKSFKLDEFDLWEEGFYADKG